MDELKNKEIFSQNLRSLMNKNNKDRNQIGDDLGLKSQHLQTGDIQIAQ